MLNVTSHTKTLVEQGEVTKVAPDHVIVSTVVGTKSDDSHCINFSQNEIPYDYLILATGSSYTIPKRWDSTNPKLLFKADTSSEIVASYPRYRGIATFIYLGGWFSHQVSS